MKYNQVRIGDGVIVKEKTVVIHSLGTLDWTLCICMAASFVVSGVPLHESIFADFEEGRIPDGSVSVVADLCRLSEFLYFPAQLRRTEVTKHCLRRRCFLHGLT